jgi:hypothetical protein
MKRYIHDGIGLRVMRGPENEIGVVVASEYTCDCGFHVCRNDCLLNTGNLPEGWAPGLGGYHHVSGAEVQKRGEKWAWYPRGAETCLFYLYQDSPLDAMALAVPVTWERTVFDHGQELHRHKTGAVVWCFDDEPLWRWGYDPQGRAVTCSFEDAKPTLTEAKVAALALVLAETPF